VLPLRTNFITDKPIIISTGMSILRSILRPPYYFMKDLSPHSRKLMARNSELKNKHNGQRGFLLLTGESLSCIDVPKLKGEYTAGLGFLFLLKDIVDLPLTLMLSTEPGPTMDGFRAPGWGNWPEELIPSQGINHGNIFTSRGTITFLDANKVAYYKRINLLDFNEPNVFYVKSNPYLFTSRAPKLDLTRRFTGGSGGMFNLVLIMIYLGFKEIYLIGAGYTYEPMYMLHFYDNLVFSKAMGRQKAELEARRAIDIRNRKIGGNLEYHGLLEKDNFYRGIYINTQRKEYDYLRDQHRILNKYARSLGVKIYNIVPDGFESPIYDKITWQEVKNRILQGNHGDGKTKPAVTGSGVPRKI
jgi:hypothetical protein